MVYLQGKLAVITLSCVLVAAGCGISSQEMLTEAVAEVVETRPAEEATLTLKVTETAMPMPTATNTPIPPTRTPEPEPARLSLEVVEVLDGSTGPVYSLDWSPDGSTFASAGHSQVNL